jgi:hypothetical protein
VALLDKPGVDFGSVGGETGGNEPTIAISLICFTANGIRGDARLEGLGSAFTAGITLAVTVYARLAHLRSVDAGEANAMAKLWEVEGVGVDDAGPGGYGVG